MPVPKFVCGVVCASGFAWSMNGDVPWNARRIVWKARLNCVTLEKRDLGTHMGALINSHRKTELMYAN
jgi:hypothetical protein